jgi:hypothetical protein
MASPRGRVGKCRTVWARSARNRRFNGGCYSFNSGLHFTMHRNTDAGVFDAFEMYHCGVVAPEVLLSLRTSTSPEREKNVTPWRLAGSAPRTGCSQLRARFVLAPRQDLLLARGHVVGTRWRFHAAGLWLPHSQWCVARQRLPSQEPAWIRPVAEQSDVESIGQVPCRSAGSLYPILTVMDCEATKISCKANFGPFGQEQRWLGYSISCFGKDYTTNTKFAYDFQTSL